MTAIPPSQIPDDPVERAATALRQTAVPEGPPEETIARTLSALRAASVPSALPFAPKRVRRYTWKIAVGVLASCVVVYVAGLLSPRPSLAFAEIAAKLRDARTLTYEVTYQSTDKKETERVKILYKEPRWLRAEASDLINISDLRQGKSLILDSAAKTAMLIDYKISGETQKEAQKKASSLIDELRKLSDKKGESVGTRRIGDLETEGFRVESEGLPLTLWANPKTKMPVLIEVSLRVADQESLVTMSDFQLDAHLDDALFCLEPPEGYKLRTMAMEEGKLEDDVAHLLRAYADSNAGKFPKSLSATSTDWQSFFKQRWGDKKPKGLPDENAVQFVNKAVRVEKFVRTNKDHGYKPDGVQLGDSTKILFWYRPDKSDTYRAVYGDLHSADVSADQLP